MYIYYIYYITFYTFMVYYYNLLHIYLICYIGVSKVSKPVPSIENCNSH